MSAGAILKCVLCHRVIESCACCDEKDCPPPLCNHCVSELVTHAIRSQYVDAGASFTVASGAKQPATES